MNSDRYDRWLTVAVAVIALALAAWLVVGVEPGWWFR